MKLNHFFLIKTLLCWLLLLGAIFSSPQALFCETASRSTTSVVPTAATGPAPVVDESKLEFDNFKRPSLLTQGIVLSLLSLLPFIVMILTSFMKIVIVLSLLRSALGVQQAPPNQIINGVAFMLSLFVMYPTGLKMYEAANETITNTRAPESLISPSSSTYIIAIARDAGEPLRLFLKRNSSVKHQALFYRMAYRVLPENFRPTLKPDDFIILVPSYITSQLKDAFEIGVLIYIPFLL